MITSPGLAPFQQELLIEEVLPQVLMRGFAHRANFFTDEQLEAVEREGRRFKANRVRNALHRLETSNPLTPSIHNAFITATSEIRQHRGVLAALRTRIEGTPVRRLSVLTKLGYGFEETVRAYGDQAGVNSVANWRFGRIVLMDYQLPNGQLGVAKTHRDGNHSLRLVASLGPALETVGEEQLLLQNGDLTAYAGYDNKAELGVDLVPHAVMATGPRQAVRFDDVQSVLRPSV